jgi:hypothetical protein
MKQVNLDRGGWRADSYRSFLKGDVERRTNLDIVKHSHVARIVFKDDNKKTAAGSNF